MYLLGKVVSNDLVLYIFLVCFLFWLTDLGYFVFQQRDIHLSVISGVSNCRVSVEEKLCF